jgi:hypothetical protein
MRTSTQLKASRNNENKDVFNEKVKRSSESFPLKTMKEKNT